MADAAPTPPPLSPPAEPPKPPHIDAQGRDWSKLSPKSGRRFRPLSREGAGSKCVKCGAATSQCCDALLAGVEAWFVPICKACFDGIAAPKKEK